LATGLRTDPPGSVRCSPNPLAEFSGWDLGRGRIGKEGRDGDKMKRRKEKREGMGGRGRKEGRREN